MVTGGKQQSDRFTEADVSAGYLIERGVAAQTILQEPSGRSSWESLKGVAALLGDRGFARVLLVSDPSHSMRIKGIAEELGLDAFTSPTVWTSPSAVWPGRPPAWGSAASSGTSGSAS